MHTDRVLELPMDSDAYIEHLSHADTAQWIERTNRYTSQSDRVLAQAGDAGLIDFARQRIDHWQARNRQSDGNDYPAAVALLRAIYDMVDRLKAWEVEQGLDGERLFRERCAELESAYDALERATGIRTGMPR